MTEKELISTQLEQAFRRKSWHGTNLVGSIRGIDEQTASWRPASGRHNIWELIVHAAYWKYSVYRRFAGDTGLKFALKGSNWLERPSSNSDETLKSDVNLLKTYHERLIESIADFNGDLAMVPNGSSTSYRDLAIGAAAHDLYHAGQIQLIKRLYQKRSI
jgi:uncharacterized damage-inducible protein DinB